MISSCFKLMFLFSFMNYPGDSFQYIVSFYKIHTHTLSHYRNKVKGELYFFLSFFAYMWYDIK